MKNKPVPSDTASQGPLTTMRRTLFLGIVLLGVSARLEAAGTLWNFDNPDDRLTSASGPGLLSYYDPDGTFWGFDAATFAKASSLGLPAMTGGDPDVLSFPACTSRQGFELTHNASANGSYGDTDGKVSNYTLIMDVLYPAASDGRWRALYQTDLSNASDADFYSQNKAGGGIGIIDVYRGSILPNTWHRVAIVMQAAPGEGKCQCFIDGRFVGGIGSTGSGLDLRWALGQSFLLLTDNDGETAAGYVSSIYFEDRPWRMEEIEALGGSHAAGATTPGASAPPITQQMSRRVGAIGHRGGFFCCAPDNTLAAVRRAISNQVPVIEIDTRLSADGVCILLHDSTVDRTTDGTGAASALTVAQLKTLDAGSWFSPDFVGERIPTVAEVMAEARGKMKLYFDLKVPGQIDAITNAIGQTGFNPDDCWFWTYSSASDAALIRSRLPNARIVWGDPAANWASDPNYFTNLRAIGVYGFDLGSYYGTPNAAFVRTAKAEGFMVSVYTILDADSMVRAAAVGVDFMETDFPHIMNQIQPPQRAAASGPSPMDEAVNVPPSPLLTWIVGSNAVAHRVYFDTNPAPAFLREQSYDLVALTNLSLDTTFYWRIDEVTPGGVVTGAVWRFTTTASMPSTNAIYEWNFDRGDLSAILGDGTMEYADGATSGLTTFGATDGAALPHIGGQPARYLHVPAFAATGNGYLLNLTDSGPNGGGAYLNRFTMIFDLLVPAPLNWTPLFNTSPGNANDADFYLAPDGSVGIGALGYSAVNLVTPNTWNRLVFAADLGAGAVSFYLNGTAVRQRTGASLLDGRFSLYSNADEGPDVLLFNEGDTSGVYTHELYVNGVALIDRTMSATEIAALGGPNANGIFARRITSVRNGTSVVLTWSGAPNVRLQKSASLTNPTWRDVPGTLGADTFTEAAPTGAAFYRLFGQ